MFYTKYAVVKRRLLVNIKCTNYKELLKRLTYTAKITKWIIVKEIL